VLNLFTPVRIFRFERPQRPGFASVYIAQLEPLCRELQSNDDKGFLVFIDASETTNLELLKIYASHFNLYLDDRVAFTRTVFALVPCIGFSNEFVKHSTYNTHWELPPATNLKAKGKTETPTMISQLSIEPFKFVILTHRSRSYDKKNMLLTHSDLNRYTDISNAEDAIRLIHKNGLKIVRMGVDTDELPDALKHLPIIDLSGKFRSDAQDLWLSANCLFLWGINGVGTWHFAHKYNRPTLVTNNYALVRGFQQSIFGFQLIWDDRKNRPLSLFEMLNLRGVVGKVSEMMANGLTFIENSESDLVSSVAEMLNYVENKLEYSEQDLSLLSQFNKAIVRAGYPSVLKDHSRPSISFLRNHKTELF